MASLARILHVMPPSPPPTRRPLPFRGLTQDLKSAWRALARRPTFALVAITTLALGIGLNTSMFSLANSLLWRPLPFPDAGNIVRLYRTTPDNQYGDFSPADYLSLKAEEQPFGQFAAYRLGNAALDNAPGSVQWMFASADLFKILGVQPFMGRPYTADDDRTGHAKSPRRQQLDQVTVRNDTDQVAGIIFDGHVSYMPPMH